MSTIDKPEHPNSAALRLPRQPQAGMLGGHVYYNETEAAEYLGQLSPRQLKDKRMAGGGPPYVRFGQSIRYRRDWLDCWCEENLVRGTNEEAARRRD